jgi:hypothetical protein
VALSDKIERNSAIVQHLISREEYSVQHKALQDRVEAVGLDLKGSITRPEYDSQHKALLDKIDDLRARYYEQSGMAAGSNVSQQLKELAIRVQELRTFSDQNEGRSTGLNAGWVYLLAALGAIGTVVSIYLALR